MTSSATSTALPHRLDRTVVIRAPRETVFRYFTDSARWAKWWGAGSSIDPQPGGAVRIRYPEGTEACGEVLEIHEPERIVFSYGYTSGKPIAAGGSRVTIELRKHAAGTELHLWHEFAEAAVRDQHVQGWRYQVAVFANVVADEIHAGASDVVDGWFEAWSLANEQSRNEVLEKIAVASIRFQDRFSLVDGISDLSAHLAACQRFMPGIRLQRKGDIRHCQGTVISDWVAIAADGAERMSGSNVFTLGPDGRIESVTGLLNPPTPK
jgi:uncharacterized protein YndB with AHSA1/START domain